MALATRCPHCDTVFRLDPHLLAPHDGRVRCGHCQEVFDAAHHQFELAQEEIVVPGDARHATARSEVAREEAVGPRDAGRADGRPEVVREDAVVPRDIGRAAVRPGVAQEDTVVPRDTGRAAAPPEVAQSEAVVPDEARRASGRPEVAPSAATKPAATAASTTKPGFFAGLWRKRPAPQVERAVVPPVPCPSLMSPPMSGAGPHKNTHRAPRSNPAHRCRLQPATPDHPRAIYVSPAVLRANRPH